MFSSLSEREEDEVISSSSSLRLRVWALATWGLAVRERLGCAFLFRGGLVVVVFCNVLVDLIGIDFKGCLVVFDAAVRVQ